MMGKYNTNRLFVLNDPVMPRLSPSLAVEIGLNESILLLQLEFLIAVSDHEIDGKRWTYQSVRGLQEMFPFWSAATINRTILSLQEKGLIIVGNHNKNKYDKTRWFALDAEGISRLDSIKLFQNETSMSQNETSVFQNETSMSQNETRSAQNETTIPDITTETTTDITTDITTDNRCPGEKNSPGRKSSEKISPKRSQRELNIDSLIETFSHYTSIPIERDHKVRNKLWRGPLGRLLDSLESDPDKVKALIRRAVDKMRADGLTLSDPNSIYKVAVALIPELNHNGRRVHNL